MLLNTDGIGNERNSPITHSAIRTAFGCSCGIAGCDRAEAVVPFLGACSRGAVVPFLGVCSRGAAEALFLGAY